MRFAHIRTAHVGDERSFLRRQRKKLTLVTDFATSTPVPAQKDNDHASTIGSFSSTLRSRKMYT